MICKTLQAMIRNSRGRRLIKEYTDCIENKKFEFHRNKYNIIISDTCTSISKMDQSNLTGRRGDCKRHYPLLYQHEIFDPEVWMQASHHNNRD